MQRIVTNPEGVAPPAGNYSHSVRVETPGATWVYIAGQVSVDPSGEFVGEGDIGRQTEQVFENLRAVLQANGASFADVVEMRTFVTDVGRLAEVRAVRDGYLPSPPPASTLVEVSGLYRPEAMIEVDAIAVVAP